MSLASRRSRSASPAGSDSSASSHNTVTSATLSVSTRPSWGGGPIAHPDPDVLRSTALSQDDERSYNYRPFMPSVLDPMSNEPPHIVPRMGEEDYVVQPGQCEFKPGEKLPRGWSRMTHPDGRPYFWHEQHRALTVEWMPEPLISTCVNTVLGYILADLSRSTGRSKEDQIVIGLEPLPEIGPDEFAALYYLVNPEKECVYWVEENSLAWDMQEPNAQLEPQMAGLYLRYQFYKHWDNFPNVQRTSTKQILQWQKALDDARADVVFSNTSTVNYNAKELSNMIEMVDCMLSRSKAAKKHGVKLEGEWLPGRMMQHIYHDRFLNLYSQRGARSDRQQSVFNNPPDQVKPSWFIGTCSALLFNAPQHHLAGLNRMWVDRVLAKEPWKVLVSTLLREWESHRLVATILVTANVSFLGVNDLPPGIVQITCFLSAISSSTSFVLITALEGRIRQMEKHDIVRAQNWLNLLNNENFGLEILAVLLGLPYGLTMWAMIFFTVSFLSFCLHDAQKLTQGVVGGYFGLHVVILLWSLWVSQEDRKPIQEHKKIPKVVVKRTAKVVAKPIRRLTRSWTMNRSLKSSAAFANQSDIGRSIALDTRTEKKAESPGSMV